MWELGSSNTKFILWLNAHHSENEYTLSIPRGSMDVRDTVSQGEYIPIFYSYIFSYPNIFQVVLDLSKSIACCFSLVFLIFGLFLSTMEDLIKCMYFLRLSSHFQKTSWCCTCIDPIYFLEEFALFCLLPVYCPSCGRCLLHISIIALQFKFW